MENQILGSIKTAGVEVTAATDNYHFSEPPNSDPYANRGPLGEQIGEPARPRKKIFMHTVQNRIKSFGRRRQLPRPVMDHRLPNGEALAGIFQHLRSQGVKHKVADELVEAVKNEFQADRCAIQDAIIAKITAVLKEKIKAPMRPLPTRSEPEVLAFIGPTGVGKTTAIAKLAARQAIQRNKKVALITVDSSRIAAAQELKVYGKAIGIPVKTAGTPSALTAAINEYGDYDLVLVDTPGINAENSREIDDLNSYIEAIRSAEVHLLLSAGTKEADLFNTIEKLSAIDVHYLIFSKLDESTTFGNLVNLLVQIQLPLSFLTNGRQVPDSIISGSVEEIVKCLLAAYLNDLRFSNSGPAHQMQENVSNHSAGGEYVANKNSDVFHCPDCKWTLKIKPKNTITFSSLQDAEARRFVPCRDCQPGTNEPLQAGFPAKERMRISSYL